METVGIALGASITLVQDGCTSMARAAVENIGTLTYNKTLGMRDFLILVSTIVLRTQSSSVKLRNHLNGHQSKGLIQHALLYQIFNCQLHPNICIPEGHIAVRFI